MKNLFYGLYGLWLEFTDDLRNLWNEFVERGKAGR